MNVIKPFLMLEKSGEVDFRVNLEAYLGLEELDWPEMVVFCRNTEPIFAPILEAVIQRGIPYIYDLDDNLFEIPLDTDLGKYHRAPARLQLLTRYLSQASRVRVYSRPLAERAKQINPATVQVDAAVDWSNIRSPRRSASGPLQIVYATSREEDPLAQIFLPALTSLLAQFPGQVEMNFWGVLPPELANHPGVHHLRPVRNYDEFMQRFSAMGFDIGLAPMLDDEFHRSKTNNKFREYSASQIAGIYSDVEIYSRCVRDGETGLLVQNSSAAWLDALTRLVTNVDLRHKISRQGLDYARENFSQEALVRLWQSQMDEVLSGDKKDIAGNEARLFVASEPVALMSAGSWYRSKLKRMSGKIREQTPASVWKKLTLTASNLWFLYRINVLKRL
mgnify:CR=1 FL=1